ncbi:MAG: tripartite tricarboxylate transporter TctB family protein [Betaproteobacteria bacterium]
MKINDAVWGALLILLSVALLVHVRSFPTIPGQKIGPALFPAIIAAGLGVCAILLIFRGIAARKADAANAAWLQPDAWVRSPRHLLAFVLVLAVNVFYIVAVDWLGFIPVGVIYLSLLFIVFRVKPSWILPLAIAVTLVIHFAFYKLLKVPLPWGLLKGIAW